MKALELTAVTNFILASEVFLFSGLLLGKGHRLGSASMLWALAMLFLAIGALAGGIDHGFFEPYGSSPTRVLMQKITWICLGLVALFALLTTGWQFFTGGRARIVFLVIGLVQLAVFIVPALLSDNFIVVIIDYAPVMILFLVLNFVGLRAGTGSWAMIVGLLLSFAASALQALGFDALSPLDRNGVYHVLMMASVVFLFLGGQSLAKA